MPTVISLLNACAGLSACMMGFVLDNRLLIVAGALDGRQRPDPLDHHVRAMNRSSPTSSSAHSARSRPSAPRAKAVRSGTPEEAADHGSRPVRHHHPRLRHGRGAGRHKVRELSTLTKRNVSVKFAIHPVAGRMPGHMNVLLAEAEIPYDCLSKWTTSTATSPRRRRLVIGANDVVNPAARHDKSSPIYGMPIIDADKAKTVMAIKRTMNSGFAGIENELYSPTTARCSSATPRCNKSRGRGQESKLPTREVAAA